VGKVLSNETDVKGMDNFVRVRVNLDVRKAMDRTVTISKAGMREFYQI
jgi:hypothetical protein